MKNWLIGILLTVLLIVSGCTGISGAVTVQPKQPEGFVLTPDNFEIVSLSYSTPATSIGMGSLDKSCDIYDNYHTKGGMDLWEREWQKTGFVITYNIKCDECLEKPFKSLGRALDCFVIVDGKKYYEYGNFISKAGMNEIRSGYFCDNPYYKGEEGEVCWYARADIVEGSEITFCCEGFCKTKTLPAYCKDTVEPKAQEDKSCVNLGCPSGTKYVGSEESNIYHDCDCYWAERIHSSNLICFKSVEEAKAEGYRAGKVCRPPS